MGDVLFLVLRRLRAPIITLLAVYAISVLGLTLVPGIDPDGRPWRMGLFHAFYVMTYTATTIGFGELPYPFSDAQRLWVTFAIYLSVVGWAYALGSLFALSQDAAFRAAAARALFVRRVARLAEPYCVICGYGRSGGAIARALDALGVRLVIVEHDRDRTVSIEIEDFDTPPLVLVADARRPEMLRDAGIAKPECRAVLAITGDDEVNQAIAIGTRVLDPATHVIARVTDPIVRANLTEFGGVQLIDPFRTFATNLALDFAAPEVLQLEEWLTGAPGSERPETLKLPHGDWVLAGFGRFGHAIAEALESAGQGWRAIDPKLPPPTADEAGQRVATASTEQALRECGIERAVGLVAGTDSDTVNLATASMARRLNPTLCIVVRQNKAYNRALIAAAKPTLAYVQADVMTHEVVQALTTPLLNRFLAHARRDAASVARRAIAGLQAAFATRVPFVWTFECDPAQPGMQQALRLVDAPLTIADLLRDPRDPQVALVAVPLMIARAPRTTPPTHAEDDLVLPAHDATLGAGDRILFAGAAGVESLQRRFLLDPSPIEYVRTGREPPRSWVFRRLAARTAPASVARRA